MNYILDWNRTGVVVNGVWNQWSSSLYLIPQNTGWQGNIETVGYYNITMKSNLSYQLWLIGLLQRFVKALLNPLANRNE